MKKLCSLFVFFVIGSSVFARPPVPPTSITVTMGTLTGFDASHNGVFLLTGTNNKNGVGDPWVYVWQDRAVNPTAKWSVRITNDDTIEIGAGSGQFPIGCWKTVGDINTVTLVPQVTPNTNTSVTIKVNP